MHHGVTEQPAVAGKLSAAVWSPPRVLSWGLGDVSLSSKKTDLCQKCSSPSVDLMVGEKKAISRGTFGYNGPCGSLGGHCAVQKSIIYIYSIYILLPPLPVPKTGPKWTYSLLEPAFRCAPPVDYCSASSTRWAPWILVRSRRSYAPLGLPAALGLR